MGLSLVAPSPQMPPLSEATVRNLDRVLRAARAQLGMDVAFVADFMGGNRVFRSVDADGGPARGGGVMPLAIGYCHRVLEEGLPELVPNTLALPSTRSLPETHSVPIGAHLCLPLRVPNGRIYGAFCCFSYIANPTLGERELQLMKVFAELVARQIDHETRPARLQQRKRLKVQAALESGDPELVFQPICRLGDGIITGVEALARFRSDPEVPPDVWFADAQAAGIGAEVELHVLRRAIAAAAELPEELTLNLNASPAALLAADLGRTLAPLGLNRVVLELSERIRVEDYVRLLKALAPLRSGGALIAVDDAGAGYESMRHMLRLKPDLIKLDVTLIRGIDHDPVRHALAAALVAYAHHTHSSIVAEGIETAGELSVLRRLGVERGQGYYLSRPLPLPVFLDLFARSGGQMANLAPIALAIEA